LMYWGECTPADLEAGGVIHSILASDKF
jgi:hypothetical protein